MTPLTNQAQNTDRELWREREGDYYADSIHVTKQGSIGINCGGFVIVKPLFAWHSLAEELVAECETSKVLLDAFAMQYGRARRFEEALSREHRRWEYWQRVAEAHGCSDLTSAFVQLRKLKKGK